MTTEPQIPQADTKDWTFTTTEPCGECGYDPQAVADDAIAAALRATIPRWEAVLSRADVRMRPAATVWSPLEYACHSRDVNHVFAGRVRQMRTEDSPHFASWSGDAAAVENRYWEQDPGAVAAEMSAATERAAAEYDAVPDGGWGRIGIRGGGGTFTISSLGHYHLHDVIHHLVDVAG